MKKILILILISLIWLIRPMVSIASQDAGDAAAFLKIGHGVRALGMGKAYVAIASDASASYWNPAGLVQLKKKEIMFMYNKPFSLISDIAQGGISFAWPLELKDYYSGIGFNVIYNTIGGIKGYDNQATPTGKEFGASDLACLLSFSVKEFFPNTDLGFTLKTISQKIWTYSDKGYGADIGSMYTLKNFRIALVIQDAIQTKIRLKSVKDIVPRKFRTGVSYTLPNQLVVSTGADLTKGRDWKGHLGMERTIARNFSIRGGYTTDTNEITAGFGFQKEYWQIDYAYARHEQLENSHRVSLSLRF